MLRYYRQVSVGEFMVDGVLVQDNVRHTASLAIHDVDGDGRLDIILAAYSPGVMWYKWDGHNIFTPHTILNVARTMSLAVGDIDGDGDLDVLTSHSSQEHFHTRRPGFCILHEQISSGTFAQSRFYKNRFANPISSISVADVDEDGDLDVLLSQPQGNRVTLYKNDNNSMNFIPYHIIRRSGGPRSVTIAYMNTTVVGLDVVTMSKFSNKIYVHEFRCDKGYYRSGSAWDCKECPQQFTTIGRGAIDISECSVPYSSLCRAGSVLDPVTESCIPCLHKEWCPDGTNCADKHEGYGCSKCIDDYFLLGNSCHPCSTLHIGYLYTLGLLGSLVVGAIIVFFGSVITMTRAIVSISITQFQILCMMTSFHLTLPPGFNAIVKWFGLFVGQFVSDLLFSPGCYNEFTSFNTWIMLVFLPVLVYIGLEASVKCFNGDRVRLKALGIYVSMLYVFAFSQSLRMWDCVPVNDGAYYVLSWDPSVRCFEDPPKKWAGYATLALLLLVIYLLWFHFTKCWVDEELSSEHNICYYKNSYELWDSQVEMPKKFVIVLWLTFVRSGTLQGILTVFTLAISAAITVYHKPYKETQDMHLQMCLNVTAIAMQIALLVYDSGAGGGNQSADVYLSTLFFFSAGIVFIFLWRSEGSKRKREPGDSNPDRGIEAAEVGARFAIYALY